MNRAFNRGPQTMVWEPRRVFKDLFRGSVKSNLFSLSTLMFFCFFDGGKEMVSKTAGPLAQRKAAAPGYTCSHCIVTAMGTQFEK